eukprot:CAMPEP_0170306480 /NCGR_PEP_ID=MMETSP0116_2-20130129/53630_1 /TAXON_ID=400756 /ORGANISM="Durinskia baltica, Strain CSIRO CS-38" /LENGTH=152 /DNA_ID=CAMNT_0010558563 /DNA_START=38 /DNA_END=493 /DNA_ORIENTATION=-
MRTAGSLPEAVVPFAERFFAWFPEVLVSLGSPGLVDHFDLPPHSGAHIRLEDTGKHKVVEVRLARKRGRGHIRSADLPGDDSCVCAAAGGRHSPAPFGPFGSSLAPEETDGNGEDCRRPLHNQPPALQRCHLDQLQQQLQLRAQLQQQQQQQ